MSGSGGFARPASDIQPKVSPDSSLSVSPEDAEARAELEKDVTAYLMKILRRGTYEKSHYEAKSQQEYEALTIPDQEGAHQLRPAAVVLYAHLMQNGLDDIVQNHAGLRKKYVRSTVVGSVSVYSDVPVTYEEQKTIQRNPKISAEVGLNLLVAKDLGLGFLEVAAETLQEEGDGYTCLVRRGADWEYKTGKQLLPIAAPWQQPSVHPVGSSHLHVVRDDASKTTAEHEQMIVDIPSTIKYTNNMPFQHNNAIYLVRKDTGLYTLHIAEDASCSWEAVERVE